MIKWTQALAVGHATIDSQHQELFRRLESLLTAMMQGDKAEVGRLFDFLGSYVVDHFGAEEKLMIEHAYPEYASHKAAHQRFVKDYTELRQGYLAGGGGAALTFKVQNWCGDWLKAHIAGTDQALAAFLKSRG
jgi:hemerythrin